MAKKYLEQSKEYAKVQEHSHHSKAKGNNFKQETEKKAFSSLEPRQSKKKTIKRPQGKQHYRIASKITKATSKDVPISHGKKMIKRYLNEKQKTYFISHSKNHYLSKITKTTGKDAPISHGHKKIKSVKRYLNEKQNTYFNRQSKNYFRDKMAQGQFAEQRHDFVKKENKVQKPQSVKHFTRRYFNNTQEKGKAYFSFGDNRQYFRQKEITVQCVNGETKRISKQQRQKNTAENQYSVPGLKQRKVSKLQQVHTAITQDKTYRLIKRGVKDKANQKLEEAGEDNVAVRAVQRTGQAGLMLNKNVKKHIVNSFKIHYYDKQNKKLIKNYANQELRGFHGYETPQNAARYSNKLYKKSSLSKQSSRTKPTDIRVTKTATKQQIKRQMQKKYIQYKHLQSQILQMKVDPIRILIEATKKVIVRNSLFVAGLSSVMVTVLIVVAIMLAITLMTCLITATTYPAEHEDLDNICAYITEQDTAYIDTFEHMGDGYPRYTLTYEGTGVVQTNKRHMISYLATKSQMEQLTLENAKETIDWFYPELYSYESWTEWEQISSNPDRWVTHLYVVVNCKTVEQVIREQNLLTEDEREYYKILNLTGGGYFPPLQANPFPGVDWTPFITSPYGWRIHPITGQRSFHSGVDIGMPEGTEISCVQSGEVTAVGSNDTEGNFITVENENMKTTYMHCSEIISAMGDEITQGDVIALVGNTGRSTGPHLHLSMWIDGVMVDPMEYITTE